MDREVLVREFQSGGRKLIDQLVRNHFPLTVAFWAKLEEEGQWYLRIVTPIVETKGPFEAYRLIRAALQACQWDDPLETITTSDIKVLETTDPLAKEVANVICRYPVPPLDTWYRDMLIYALPQSAPQPAGS